ncbi:MAG TPA: DUF952 domain-containing protein [Ilumatobacter sp.]
MNPSGPSDRIVHLALPGDWPAAGPAGDYRISSRGVTLEQEGFIHCSFPDQVVAVANRFYGDLTELTVLEIDPRRLAAEVVVEPAADGVAELFPHVYGPIPNAAVVTAAAWRRAPGMGWQQPPLPGGDQAGPENMPSSPGSCSA